MFFSKTIHTFSETKRVVELSGLNLEILELLFAELPPNLDNLFTTFDGVGIKYSGLSNVSAMKNNIASFVIKYTV